jgi:hypothetical protein
MFRQDNNCPFVSGDPASGMGTESGMEPPREWQTDKLSPMAEGLEGGRQM